MACLVVIWFALLSNLVCAGDKHLVSKGPCVNRSILMTLSTSAALGKGGGVLDKPIIEKTTPGRESEFDLRYYCLQQSEFSFQYDQIHMLICDYTLL